MTHRPLRLVLDTNVVLDGWVFADPSTRALLSAIASSRAHAFVHQPALDELARVLTYPQFALDEAKQRAIHDAYASVARYASLPDGFTRDSLLLPPGFPSCRDPDDDPFVALAFHAQATLVSKDRAVLKLRRKARRFGVTICTLAELPLTESRESPV
jgi:putative PIN family toxin of toxin-antitoxin system